ncbi:acetate--CoA ligase [Salegentibacter sp. F14]
MGSFADKTAFNLVNYARERASFSWNNTERELLQEKETGKNNIGYLTVDRHATGSLKENVALRFIQKDRRHQDYSYTRLKEETSRFANVLSTLGIQKGETVFSLTGRIPPLYITALGTLKTTAVFCPLFSVFGPEPVFQRLHKGKAIILVTTLALYNRTVKNLEERLPTLRYIILSDLDQHQSEKVLSWSKLMKEASVEFRIPETSAEDPALLHFTSGTTGMPKGALHVHKAVLTHYITGKYVLDFHPGDLFWCTADPGWVTGTSYGIIAPLVNGVTSIIDQEEFDAMRWYEILEEQKINIWYTAPTAIRRLMRMDIQPGEKFDLSALRVILSVGEPLSAEAVLWGKRNFGIPILDNWWQTETGGIMIANYPSLEVKPGSMGKPLPGIDAEIAEVTQEGFRLIETPGLQGHLVLKQGFPSLFRAYLNEEERYKKCFSGDWYLTGDLARKDSEGYFWFIGRVDDIIKTSGHMVGPFEVESTLMRHPAIAEAAVIGKPEASIGELVKAFIVLKQGKMANEEMKLEITGFARKHLGPAVAPKEIEFTESIPKTRSGKILRRLLKSRELGLPEGDTSTLEHN